MPGGDDELFWADEQLGRALRLVSWHKNAAQAAGMRRDQADAETMQHLGSLWALERRLREIRGEATHTSSCWAPVPFARAPWLRC